ncbi:MAG: HAD-IA family hydrolase [Candidatus Aegiribacteria sp.]|nr:HAD-IA family hydrolase [Candidatus Aegiribacteria sp.]MBD3295497.1 HAD-IA family hydrolase [Candidatus Fermentibacteria bacterium]
MYYLFDMDGVLVDSKEAWFGAFNEIGNISREEFESRYWGRDLQKNIDELDTSRRELCNRVFPKHSSRIEKVDSMEEVLSSLDGPKALITNTTRKCTEEILSGYGLNDYFNVMITSDQVEEGKPDPSMVRRALDELGARPSQSVVIGDSPHDMQAGKEAGCITLGIGTDGDYRVDSVKELPDKLEELAEGASAASK